MWSNLLAWLVLLLITIGLAWLALLAWRSRNGLARWLGGPAASLGTLLFGLVSVVVLVGLFKAYWPRGSAVQPLQVAGTAEQIERGRHLANAFCVDCHSPTGELPLIGGVDLGQDIPIPLGSFISVNLTPGGPLKDLTDGEIFRILREGVNRDGRPLVVMSAVRARYMSDEDLHSVIAYLRSQPASDNPAATYPPDRINLLGVVVMALNLAPPEPPVYGSITAPPKGTTVEYGKYMVEFQDCMICHGAMLDGRNLSPLVEPPGPDLEIVKFWTSDEFITTLRTGVDPSGHELSAAMPWRSIGRLDDVELAAIYSYIVSLP
jgi:mono/diheme cytochrome c family protein